MKLILVILMTLVLSGCASYDKSTFIRIKAKEFKGQFELYQIEGEDVAVTINRQVYLSKKERPEVPNFQDIKETITSISISD